MWSIVFLAMGGIALGKGVMSSGLLNVMDELIRNLIEGLSLYTVVLVLSAVVLVCNLISSGLSHIHFVQVISTFISHTIASVLLVPIAQEVGNNLPGNHGNLLIFLTGLICSTGMVRPRSMIIACDSSYIDIIGYAGQWISESNCVSCFHFPVEN